MLSNSIAPTSTGITYNANDIEFMDLDGSVKKSGMKVSTEAPKPKKPCRTLAKEHRMYIVSLKNYDTFKFHMLKTHADRDTFMAALQEAQGTSFEVLKFNVIRMFLDLENIPFNQPEMYKKIINDFIDYAELDKEVPYTVTINKGSRHLGFSHHVIFGVAILRSNMNNLVKQFRIAYPQYADYVDFRIYTRNRLFRLPGQTGITNERTREALKKAKDTNGAERDLNINPDYNPKTDVHTIMEQCGTPKTDNPYENDFIIQNVIGLQLYDKQWFQVIEDQKKEEEERKEKKAKATKAKQDSEPEPIRDVEPVPDSGTTQIMPGVLTQSTTDVRTVDVPTTPPRRERVPNERAREKKRQEVFYGRFEGKNGETTSLDGLSISTKYIFEELHDLSEFARLTYLYNFYN